MGFMSGKRALIVGVASDRSIAWGIAQAMHREGAELAFTYVNEKFKDRVQPLAESLGSKIVVPLEVNVADVRGASTSKILNVRVTPTPRLEVEQFALTTTVGQKLTVNVNRR